MKITVLGTGAWGTAMGKLAQNQGHEIQCLHHTIQAWPSDLGEMLFCALPVQYLRPTLTRLPAPGVPILNLSKGLEVSTGRRVTQILQDVWGSVLCGVLSGPTLAVEIEEKLPAAAVIAAETDELAERFQKTLHQPNFRLYRSTDVVGVELGGALKNIYAIGGGVCAGLKLGENSQAALLTRCLAEMIRIGIRAGGKPETFAGLSGVGDLILTGQSAKSRNFRVGLQLAAGKTLEEAISLTGGTAEGVPTSKSVFLNTSIPLEEKPIVTQIHGILYEGKSPLQAVRDLLTRDMKAE